MSAPTPHQEWQRDGFTISTDPARLDRDAIHAFLTNCYWAKGIPRDVMERSIEHSMPFGIYEGTTQIMQLVIAKQMLRDFAAGATG